MAKDFPCIGDSHPGYYPTLPGGKSPDETVQDPIVQWPRTPPFHGGNTGSNPVRVAISALDQKTFINRGTGIVVGVMSLLLLQKGLSSKDHPDIDERIEMAMKAIAPEETHGLWLVGLAAIKLWDVHYKKNLKWPQFALTPKQAFQDILAAIRKRQAKQL